MEEKNNKEKLEKTVDIDKKGINEDSNIENNVTREINLDELYDGAINNTVIIDPVSKEEVLQLNKKSNKTFFIIIIVVIVLLVLYYVNSNFNISFKKNKKSVTDNVSNSTTTVTTTKKLEENGTLICEFSAKSDSENQNITFKANYIDSLIKTSEFNYVLISNLDTISEEANKLQSEYESYFINNAAVIGNNVTFEKIDKGFNFTNTLYYDKVDFNSIVIEDGKMNYFVKPNKEDTYLSLKSDYEKKGFSCKLTEINYNEKTSENIN